MKKSKDTIENSLSTTEEVEEIPKEIDKLNEKNTIDIKKKKQNENELKKVDNLENAVNEEIVPKKEDNKENLKN